VAQARVPRRLRAVPLAAGLEETGGYLVAEIEKWVGVVRGANIRID
jgi:hypothetical protein